MTAASQSPAVGNVINLTGDAEIARPEQHKVTTLPPQGTQIIP